MKNYIVETERHAYFTLSTKATNTHSYYVILIAFPLQQWLHERRHCCVILVCTLLVLHSSNKAWVTKCSSRTAWFWRWRPYDPPKCNCWPVHTAQKPRTFESCVGTLFMHNRVVDQEVLRTTMTSVLEHVQFWAYFSCPVSKSQYEDS
jgi:hypothetical protein